MSKLIFVFMVAFLLSASIVFSQSEKESDTREALEEELKSSGGLLDNLGKFIGDVFNSFVGAVVSVTNSNDLNGVKISPDKTLTHPKGTTLPHTSYAGKNVQITPDGFIINGNTKIGAGLGKVTFLSDNRFDTEKFGVFEANGNTPFSVTAGGSDRVRVKGAKLASFGDMVLDQLVGDEEFIIYNRRGYKAVELVKSHQGQPITFSNHESDSMIRGKLREGAKYEASSKLKSHRIQGEGDLSVVQDGTLHTIGSRKLSSAQLIVDTNGIEAILGANGGFYQKAKSEDPTKLFARVESEKAAVFLVNKRSSSQGGMPIVRVDDSSIKISGSGGKFTMDIAGQMFLIDGKNVRKVIGPSQYAFAEGGPTLVRNRGRTIWTAPTEVRMQDDQTKAGTMVEKGEKKQEFPYSLSDLSSAYKQSHGSIADLFSKLGYTTKERRAISASYFGDEWSLANSGDLNPRLLKDINTALQKNDHVFFQKLFGKELKAPSAPSPKPVRQKKQEVAESDGKEDEEQVPPAKEKVTETRRKKALESQVPPPQEVSEPGFQTGVEVVYSGNDQFFINRKFHREAYDEGRPEDLTVKKDEKTVTISGVIATRFDASGGIEGGPMTASGGRVKSTSVAVQVLFVDRNGDGRRQNSEIIREPIQKPVKFDEQGKPIEWKTTGWRAFPLIPYGTPITVTHANGKVERRIVDTTGSAMQMTLPKDNPLKELPVPAQVDLYTTGNTDISDYVTIQYARDPEYEKKLRTLVRKNFFSPPSDATAAAGDQDYDEPQTD